MIQAISGKGASHKPSHCGLLLDDPADSPFATQVSKLEAFIVPASRRASSFDDLIKLSARLDTMLVVLCSRLTKVEDVAERVARTPGAQALIIDVPKGYRIPDMPSRTSTPEFRDASGGRVSDLSTKRNLGLLLARLNGWLKIVFVDDDITLTETDGFLRLARRLERNQIAGMVCREYPDNSVVCHARRLAGLPQDNFVSGSVLGVHCGEIPMPFFPDIYNEDWFFFSKAVARYQLSSVGNAEQRPYKPYADPNRAKQEEFGDLLAEGLYSLIDHTDDPYSSVEDTGDRSIDYRRLLDRATWDFWYDFINARNDDLTMIRGRLEKLDANAEARQAVRSLLAAGNQLAAIKPDLCLAFLDAWYGDLEEWETSCKKTSNVRNVWEAMDHLGIRRWRFALFGDSHAAMPKRIASRPVRVSC